jgi:hypothetical protein
VFAGAAFGHDAPDTAPFVSVVEASNHGIDPPAEVFEQLMRLRERVTSFLDWAVDRILASEPRLVGCTSTFQQHVASLASSGGTLAGEGRRHCLLSITC